MSVGEIELSAPAPDLARVVEVTRGLVDIVGDSRLARLSVQAGGVRWEIEGGAAAPVPAPPPAPMPAPAPEPTPAPSPAPEVRQDSAVLAPSVGVFTRAPGPEIGGPVASGQLLAHVEAMRMRTEVVADRAGVLREVHVADGEIVEYGQRLFTVGPA